ncbi:NACHT domain-containing protein [Pedobacter chitinilyticus]|uniref:NACHT domain-containing protein n=1 Tax=Pedobacter chitinilyticus TaxID=2233776 RepID=A0A451GD47_9SPHI|nr:hypothetical protein [Pedobacter chitinilyticus]RWU10766.1 hypothetical protein DPV69_05405 [Pedobacter chitinilyticus]
MPQTIILDKIRRLILLKTGIKTISPSDCRSISSLIQKETQKNISETTLKRLFGFAEVKNKFSKYTINALLEYIEKNGNYTLMERELLHQTGISEKFSSIQSNATDISLNTLKAIKSRSTVPYHYTSPRFFARLDFEYFYDSHYSFTAFVSQAGYGKSILLSHLVQSLFLDQNAKYSKDTILFVSARDIFDDQNEYSNVENRIKAKIGLNTRTNLITYFKERHEKSGSKLVIVIDGFSDLVTNKVSKPIIFDKLINLISFVEDESSIKIVFAMRSTMWSRFYDQIKNMSFVKRKWFPGTYFSLKHQSNIPPLATEEVEEILKKIDPNRSKEIDASFKAKLKYPFYIQWYYLLKEEFPNFDFFTNILSFEIVDRFIHEKIYNASYATEKVLFCKKLIQLSDYGKGQQAVQKSLFIADLSNFKNAYMELLAEGILMEEKQQEDGFVVDLVRFVHPHVFEYFLFVELLHTANNQMNASFFEAVNDQYAGKATKFQILQWSARLLIIKGEFNALNSLLKLNLSNYEKTYLIYFIAENLNYRQRKQPLLSAYLEEEELHQMMMENIIHFDFADSCYKDAVSSLLSISRNDKYSYIYQVILAIYDCFSFDKEQLKQRIRTMQSLSFKGEDFVINPLDILKSIYAALAGECYKNDVLNAEIEAFKQGNKISGSNAETIPDFKEMLSFILLRLHNSFIGNRGEAVRLLNAMVCYFPKMMFSDSIASAYLFSMMAFIRASAHLENEQKGLTEKISVKIFHIHSIGNSTPYIQTIYLSSKAYEAKNSRDYNTAIICAEKCLETYKRNHLSLHQTLMYNLLIDIYEEMDNYEKKNEYMHQKLSLIDQKKVDASIFHNIK